MAISEEATVTSKGQVTIPKRIREAVGIEEGTELEFTIDDDGTVRVRPKRPPLDRLRDVKERLRRHEVDVDALRRESKAAWESVPTDRS